MAMVQFFVGGLSPDADEGAFEKLLSSIAHEGPVEVVRDLETGMSRGYGVVRVTEAAAEAVERLNGTEVAGRRIVVSRMPVTMPGEMAARDWLHRNAEKVLRHIGVNQGQRVLDYGCGPGIFTIPCARIVGAAGKVYALDVRARTLEEVKRQATDAGLENVETILQEPGNLSTGLHSYSLDAVLVFDMMQDVADKRGLIQEAERVLEPGGLLSIFPMHVGNAPALEAVGASGAFVLRDKFDPPNSKSPSSVLNFVKNGSPRKGRSREPD